MQIFDLTKKVRLQPTLQKKYNTLRMILHVFFVIAMLFVAYRILFPIIPLDFDLSTPNSTKNTLVSPRLSSTNEFPSKGAVKPNDTLLFNANPEGQFSNANISFILGKNSTNLENIPLKIRRSYQAFFYPTGEPLGFKNSTLLSTIDANYYIISNGLLRKFANTDIILALGYPKSAFANVSSEDLKLNTPGTDITSADNYPDDTLFLIDNTFYQLRNQQLFPFISAAAFLSQFESVSVISKNADFLKRYPVSEIYLGFADGTLVSSADSVYILSEDKSYPIENEVTFSAMGFDWENVIPISTDELGAYKKQKQFTNNSAHPNGTIFLDQKKNSYFLIKDNKKLPLGNTAIIQTYSKQKPILADSTASEKELSCVMQKKILNSNAYQCNISLENLSGLVGNDYQIALTFPATANISKIETTFSTPLTFASLKNSLSVIKNRLENR